MSRVTVSIREFALPVPRTGSIEAHSGYGRALEGQEIHLAVQERRMRDCDEYRPEVKIEREFACGDYVFAVGGRMDGFVPGDPPLIEEIKSAFNAYELSKRLTEFPDTHPYCLQLRTYGYFYWLEHGIEPDLSFHLVSTRNGESIDLELALDRPGYERWLAARLDELVEETARAERRAHRRQKVAESFAFPFAKPRSGQVDLIETVELGLADRKRLLVQAPTGLGKTAGVLYPAMKEALGRGQRVVYVTPKNSQHSVAEDAIERFQEVGSPIKSLTITAKSKICFKNEPLCNPEYCEFARDYYEKVARNGLIEKLAKKRSLNARAFRKLGEEYEVCPFELQLDAAAEADAVICDYNYVFAPRSAFGRLTQSSVGQTGKPNLVIDEAHNLVARALEYYSPALSTVALRKIGDELELLPERFRRDGRRLIDEAVAVVNACAPSEGPPRAKIDPPVEPFLEHEAALRAFLSRYLESDVEIQPGDPVLRLTFYGSEFTAALGYVADPEQTAFFSTVQRTEHGATIRITCCDASAMLEKCYDEYEHVVAFSATLKPFDYYARLTGLRGPQLRTAEFQSPFPRANRKLLIIPQISTKYSDRERNYQKIAETVRRVSALRRGNYFVFFPSFDFLYRVHELFRPEPGFAVVRQERETKAADIEALLERLRSRSEPTIVFAVQGGVYSEGVDYPGDMVIGAFVVGPALPTFDLEREQMREYYDRQYGNGFDYAYTFPAMAKAVQAAGRVIRSETDRGLIVLMDTRFTHPAYTRSMPADWYDTDPRELVSPSILREVELFWQAGANGDAPKLSDEGRTI